MLHGLGKLVRSHEETTNWSKCMPKKSSRSYGLTSPFSYTVESASIGRLSCNPQLKYITHCRRASRCFQVECESRRSRFTTRRDRKTTEVMEVIGYKSCGEFGEIPRLATMVHSEARDGEALNDSLPELLMQHERSPSRLDSIFRSGRDVVRKKSKTG